MTEYVEPRSRWVEAARRFWRNIQPLTPRWKYIYFVTYDLQTNAGRGCGSIELVLAWHIRNFAHIREIGEFIKTTPDCVTNNVTGVVVQNWKYLRPQVTWLGKVFEF